MRILHAIYDSVDNPWLGGGGAQRTQEMYSRLSAKHQILVVCGNVPNAQNEIAGVRYKRVGLAGNYYLSRLSYLLLAPLVIAFQKADVFVEDLGMPFGLFLTFLKKNDVCSVQYIPTEAYAKKRRLVGRTLTGLFWRSVKKRQRFVTVSPFAKREILARKPGADVEVILNGINIPDIKGATSEHILFIGRIDMYQKGLDVLIDALAELNQQGAKFKCVIAGSGEASQVQKLHQLIADKQLEDSVHCVGAVHGAEKHLALLAASMVVIPSRNETFGIVTIEAFSYGKPVVASRVGGLADVTEESQAGLLFESGNSSQLAKEIKQLLNDQQLRATLSKRGLEFSRDLDWDNIVEKFDNYLEHTL